MEKRAVIKIEFDTVYPAFLISPRKFLNLININKYLGRPQKSPTTNIYTT